MKKHQRIAQWEYPRPWLDRSKAIERYDLVRTRKGDIGMVTSIMSNCTARVDFIKKRHGYKTNFSFYKPETLEIIRKGGGQVWVMQ